MIENITNTAVNRLVESVLEESNPDINIGFIEVETSLVHGDQKIFSVVAHCECERLEFSVAIDIKQRG